MKVEIIDVTEIRDVDSLYYEFCEQVQVRPEMVNEIKENVPLETITINRYQRVVERVYINGKVKYYVFKNEDFYRFMMILKGEIKTEDEGFISKRAAKIIEKYSKMEHQLKEAKELYKIVNFLYTQQLKEVSEIKSHKFLYKLILFFDKFKK